MSTTAYLAIRFDQAFGRTADIRLRLENTDDLAQDYKTGCQIKWIERAI